MIWSREDDIEHDYYRPAAMARFAGALDAHGTPVSVRSRYAGGVDGESTFTPYAIGDKSAKSGDTDHPIRTGPWRSALNSQHGFFKESFIDELAYAAKKDPYAFRRDLLSDRPRFRAALDKAAAMVEQSAARLRRSRDRPDRMVRYDRRGGRPRRGLIRGKSPRPRGVRGRGLR